MSTSAQERLKKLLPNRPRPAKQNPNDLHFSERELLEYRERQQKATEPPPNQVDQDVSSPAKEENDVEAQTTVKPKSEPFSNVAQGPQDAHNQQGRIPGTDSDHIVFLPRGIWRGGLPATPVNDDDQAQDSEATQSTHKPIGHFCIWSLVAKFPYKYMQDPDSKVSRRFFAAEKIFERNWQV